MRRILLGVFLCAAIALATQPVGSLSSSRSVVLSGSSIPETAVSSLPVIAGDVVKTSGSTAVVVFADKSRLVIAANSQVALVAGGSGLQLQVVSGSATMDKANKSTIELIQKNQKPGPRSKACPHERDREDGNCGIGNDR